MLHKQISIGSYFPEVNAFGTLITITAVFRLIICKNSITKPLYGSDYLDVQ